MAENLWQFCPPSTKLRIATDLVVGSSHAMVGFASFKDGDNQFLETRIRRSDGVLLPEETSSIVGEDGVQSMVDAFSIMSDVGKDIVRIATAASSVEADAFVTAGSVISEDTVDSPSIAGLSFEDVSGVVEESDEPSEEDMKRAKVLASDAAVLLTKRLWMTVSLYLVKILNMMKVM